MDIKEVDKIREWFNTTDLDEICFRDGNFRFSFVKKGFSNQDVKINSNLVPVLSSEVGIFSFSKKGKAVNVKKGDNVKKGEVLGYIEVLSKTVEIKSPCDGVIRLIAVEDGSLVEYSQLLFVIE